MNQSDKKNRIIELYLLLGLDLLCIGLSYATGIYLRYGSISGAGWADMHRMVVFWLMLSCVIYSFLFDWNREFMKRGYFVEFVAILKYSITMMIAAAVFLFLFKQAPFFSRLLFAYFACLNIGLTYLSHSLLKCFLRKFYRSERYRSQVMVVTCSSGMEEILANLKKAMAVSYEITAVAVMDRSMPGGSVLQIPVVAGKDNLMEVARQLPLDEVFLHLPEERREDVRSIIRDFESMGIVCHYNIDISEWNARESTVGQFGNYTVITYAINQMDYRRLMVKRLMDIAGGIAGLLITAVLFPFIAAAVRLDSPGPIMFSQIRIGKNGRRFKIYKFRSMYIDAEERKKELLERNEIQGLMFKMKEDPRITRVGKFLRKSSLDELPQFYNIVKGDMSLVGTRPPTEDEFEQYSLYYRRRLCMTPGLTGLWQVSGRSEIEDFDDVVKYDLLYIDNWTIGLDIKILIKTVWVVVAGKGSK